MQTYDPHRSTTEVRQANRSLDNFWVLIISTLVVIAVFAAIYLAFFATTPTTAT